MNIRTVHRWKGRLPGRTNSNKVPTLIALDEDNGYKPYWGYSIPERLSDKTIKYVKLLLEPDASRRISGLNSVVNPQATGDFLRTLQKRPVDIAALYVKCVWKHAKKEIITDLTQATFDFADKAFLLTVPAVWSDRAKHNTYLIAAGAGLADDDYTLSMISEPEAAAVCVLKEPDRARSLSANDVYLVVDAGGGTVDLTSYQVQTVEPLSLREVAAGDGDVCGATFLEAGFLKVMRQLLGSNHVNQLNPDAEKKIISDWELSIRDLFTGEDDRRWVVVTPGITNHPRIISGMMQLKAAEIRPIFAPIFRRIERLIEKQIKSLANKNLRPKAILLVGGLGCNHYLSRRLKKRFETNELADGRTRIKIRQPDSAWESVSKGAVRCEVLGLGSLVSLRIARYNIGFQETLPWDDSKDYLPTQKTWDDFYCAWSAKGVICWVLRRNDEIKHDTSVTYERSCCFWEDTIDEVLRSRAERKTLVCLLSLLASQEDDAPSRPTEKTRNFAAVNISWDLTKFPKETVRLRRSPQGRAYRAVDLQVHMKQSMAGMRFSYSIQDQFCEELVDVDFHSLPQDVDNDEVMSILGV